MRPWREYPRKLPYNKFRFKYFDYLNFIFFVGANKIHFFEILKTTYTVIIRIFIESPIQFSKFLIDLNFLSACQSKFWKYRRSGSQSATPPLRPIPFVLATITRAIWDGEAKDRLHSSKSKGSVRFVLSLLQVAARN